MVWSLVFEPVCERTKGRHCWRPSLFLREARLPGRLVPRDGLFGFDLGDRGGGLDLSEGDEAGLLLLA
jgi:hypothetical protein